MGYPVYMPPYGPMRPVPPPGPFMTNLAPPPRVDFNGLNYVSTHQRRGPRLTTYGEWTQSRGRRRHSSSPIREAVPVKSPRSKSSSKDSSHPTSSSRGRPRKRTSNATQQPQVAEPQHYLRIHTTNHQHQLQPPPPDGIGGIGSSSSRLQNHHEVNVLSPQQRKEHSRSPSDGMILTASGLSGLNHRDRDTTTTILQQQHREAASAAINSENVNLHNNNQLHNNNNNNSNQVVIVDGLNNHNDEDDNVYLTTS